MPARFDVHAMVAIGDAIEQRGNGGWVIKLGTGERAIAQG
jgi:hypothetical protein